MFETIQREEIQRRLESGEAMTLVEALPARYYQDRHLPGAINIPHDEIEERAAERLPDKSAFIVVYCASTGCRNSAIAADTLDRLGYRNVHEYVEGKEDWEGAGLPFETGTEAARNAA